MPGSKKAHRNPTRLQPRRATRDVGKKGLPEAEDNSTLLPPTGGGVHKATGPVGIAHERKPRGPAARKLKKLQQALIKKVDARDPQEALAEQSRLLGLSVAPSPTSTKSAKTPKPAEASKGQG
ncbi:hypothetical protein HD806DRAFT_549095 [Xylariaceae sp. AK1471]|nr:hypothetical protein HD806DRAFT_549095 [Xylariaceae sp. AK1471]